MMSKKTRRLPLLMLVLLALALEASACGQSYDGKDYSARGGEDATNGKVALDDVWIDAPAGVPAGARTGLRLYLANDSGQRDALTSVSTPIAERARLVLHGEPVHRITVGAWSARDLEWRSNGDGVELTGLKTAVQPGQWFDATFRFQHSRPITMQITVAPLGAGSRTHPTGSSTTPGAGHSPDR